MNPIALFTAALSLGLIHTLIGVDHYLPFIALGKSRQWSIRTTLGVVAIAGTLHVLSSILLGIIGLSLKTSVETLVGIESVRGSLSTWFLIASGLVVLVMAYRNHLKHSQSVLPTKGLLVAFLVLGPCEPLIPLLMAPAAHDLGVMLSVATLFGLTTVVTMMMATWIGLVGLNRLPESVNRWMPMLSGLTMTLCGVLMLTLGV